MSMTVRTGVQFLGEAALADEINRYLGDKRYRTFRCAVAFARWSGLHLIDVALRGFADRKGNQLDCIIGVDLGGTTIEALTYLSELPHSRVRVLRSGMPRVVFHSKVYAFEGSHEWVAIVGSSNLSTGGLHSNIESYIILEGGDSDRDILDGLFEPYENAPFTDEHLREVDQPFLQELAKDLARYTSTPPDREERRRDTDPPPLDPGFKPPKPKGRPPEPATKQPGQLPPEDDPVPVPAGEDQLYMELWDETGGGTQVQIAKRVFEEYFGASPGVTTYIRLETPRGTLPAVRLQHFGNVTFRVGLPFVGPGGGNRRGVLRFTRTALDQYRVELRMAGKPGYKKWLSLCDDETGFGRKHWGIH